MERTLSIIKPDSVGKGHIGEIIATFEKLGFRIAAMKMLHLSVKEAEGFYAVHKSRPFFQELVDFMISGPVVVMVLEGENAVIRNREIMGATNPQEAAQGTLRARFGESIGINAVHGSDSLENATIEIRYFFSEIDIVNSSTIL
ncbi:Nucleoside diphosphate kinase [Chlamydia avium]|nr:nucleoside-diphosphate kinase [Chlamydia avium]EPP36526.1 nucleoside diphosphate kinase [Chlamydia psittaci 10_743_SC13]EPP38598.1 nucleoside diphosphate kinase [Chlamydia avium]VVT43351.1 Nucleoside diphosphate kinase [Chlamydia avium]